MYLSVPLREKIGSATWEKNTIGMSGAGVYKLSGIEAGGNAYLKMAKSGGPETLRAEMEKLKWLADFHWAPKVLHYENNCDTEYILLSEIEGENLKESEAGILHPTEIGRMVAEGLLAIHQLNIANCPFDESIQVKLNKAAQRIQAGLVDADDFDPVYHGQTAEQLFSLLEMNQPQEENIVFTHGDYSLANILTKNFQITGFVDWGRAGLSDRHQDIAIAIRSLQHNFTDEASQMFINTYGRDKIDFDKVRYYILLDELF